MSLKLIYITTKDRAQAESIGRQLVESRLAACVNIIDGMTSLYHWQGQLESSQEAILIAKTDQARAEALVARVKALHSYEVPCALVLPIEGGNPAYLAWLQNALGPATGPEAE